MSKHTKHPPDARRVCITLTLATTGKGADITAQLRQLAEHTLGHHVEAAHWHAYRTGESEHGS